MNRLERRSQAYLCGLGIGEVSFEPEGTSQFPDFRVGRKTAVEVTRLTKPIGGGYVLETVEWPTIHALENVLGRLTFPTNETTRYVDLDCRYPMETRVVGKELKRVLNKIAEKPQYEVNDLRVCDELSINVFLGTFFEGVTFKVAGFNSPDYAGWLIADLLEQCEFALQRKENKLEKLSSKYNSAWLCVGNHLTRGLSDSNFQEFLNNFAAKSKFEKLILIDENDIASSRTVFL